MNERFLSCFSTRPHERALPFVFSTRHYEGALPFVFSTRPHGGARPFVFSTRHYERALPFVFSTRHYEQALPFVFSTRPHGGARPFSFRVFFSAWLSSDKQGIVWEFQKMEWPTLKCSVIDLAAQKTSFTPLDLYPGFFCSKIWKFQFSQAKTEKKKSWKVFFCFFL